MFRVDPDGCFLFPLPVVGGRSICWLRPAVAGSSVRVRAGVPGGAPKSRDDAALEINRFLLAYDFAPMTYENGKRSHRLKS